MKAELKRILVLGAGDQAKVTSATPENRHTSLSMSSRVLLGLNAARIHDILDGLTGVGAQANPEKPSPDDVFLQGLQRGNL